MNIFERHQKLSEELKNRSNIFVRLAVLAINSLADGDESSSEIPDFINSYHGFHAEVYPFDNTKWISNPNYKPNLSDEEHRKPENIELQTGFSSIHEVEKMCRIVVVECQDSWDDCAGEPETWNLEFIPQELFLNGSEKDVVQFFTDRYKEKVERELKSKFTDKWSTLFHYYTPEELEAYAKAMRDVENDNSRFAKTLEIMKDFKTS